jgi:hypothetical protein
MPVVALPRQSSANAEPPVPNRCSPLKKMARFGTSTNIAQCLVDKTPASVKNRWQFLRQEEGNRTFGQGKEANRMPEDENPIGWDAGLDDAFRRCGVHNPPLI